MESSRQQFVFECWERPAFVSDQVSAARRARRLRLEREAREQEMKDRLSEQKELAWDQFTS